MTDAIRVLYVDDTPDFADLAAQSLKRVNEQFTVETAMSASDGLDQLADHDFDCIVSGYDMPGQNGIEFLETVRDDHPELPFILVTGKGSGKVASDAISVGATDYFQKASSNDQYELLANRIQNAVEQRRTQKQLAETEQRLQTIADNAHTTLWAFTADWNDLLFVNLAYEDIWGHSTNELREHPQSFLEGVHPDDRAAVKDAMEHLSGGESIDIEFRVNPQENFNRWVWVQGEPVFDDGGEVEAVVGYARDITEHKEHEQKLTALHDVADNLATSKSVEQACELTLEASREILDFDMSVIAIEDAEMLSPVAVSEDIPPGGMAEMSVNDGIVGKTYRTGESFLIDDLTTRDDANPQGPYKSLISIPIGDHGAFQAVAETPGAFDDTDLELAELLVSHIVSVLDGFTHERQLERQNKRLDEFTSVVAHDLRNPLNVAQGRIALAKDEYDSEHLDAAASSIERSFDLIEDMLTLAREGQRISEMEPIDVASLIETCWESVDTTNAALLGDLDATIEADRSRLRQLLENLICNAVEHGGEDVTVRVGALPTGFYIEDDGSGIPEDERETVFNPGYSESQDGTGFGLAITRGIADAHDWEIQLTEGADGGARFEFTRINFVDG